MSRVFMICPEPVRRLTAGVGTRFVALAEVLRDAGHRVTLAIPNDAGEAEAVGEGIDVITADPDRLGAQAEGHDWVLLHGHLGNHYLCQRDDLPVVVDLYDPFLVENLHYHRALGFEPYRTDHATWKLQLGRGDFFLCSSAEQRFFYLGWLGALGRVNPLILDDDPRLEGLIAELPFGAPDEEPPPKPAREEVLGDAVEGGPVLYFGGIYDWYDPAVVLEAVPDLLAADRRTVVVFVDHPHPDDTPLSLAEQTRRTAEARGWLGSTVRFERWRPYHRRFELAAVSDLALITHRPGLETDLSLRTRMVDLLWLGLPVVATAGGAMSKVIEDTGAGLTVPPGDAKAMVAAVRALFGDRRRLVQAGDAGRAWARSRRWVDVAAPLLEFAAAPRRDPHRDRFTDLAPASSSAEEPVSNRLKRAIKRLGGGR
ncbi:MAG: glycosyltransferase [Thermoanaerobaculales bacterium]|nr:glycosyltransferase [Thermoanaerobaculales bacterium]